WMASANGASSHTANPGDNTPPPVVPALGTLEPKGGVRNLGATTGDRVGKYADGIEPGKKVSAGDPLVYLSSYDARAAQERAADLAVEDAEKRKVIETKYGDNLVQEAQLGVDQLQLYDLDLKAQQAKLAELQGALAQAQKDLKRIQNLDQ